MTRTKRPAISPRERCICHELRKLTRLVTSHYDRALAPSRLKITQFSLLAQVDAVGAISVSELAQLMAADDTTVLRAVNGLVRHKLVEVDVGADKRERVVALTPKGRAAIRGAFSHWQRAQETFRDAVGIQSVKSLLRAIKRTMAAVDA